jgi:hypothetical protein
MLIEGSPVWVILGTFVALEPGLRQRLGVLGVRVVVKLLEVFILKTKTIVNIILFIFLTNKKK